MTWRITIYLGRDDKADNQTARAKYIHGVAFRLEFNLLAMMLGSSLDKLFPCLFQHSHNHQKATIDTIMGNHSVVNIPMSIFIHSLYENYL
jgi:hypothetical protein